MMFSMFNNEIQVRPAEKPIFKVCLIINIINGVLLQSPMPQGPFPWYTLFAIIKSSYF